MTDEPRQVEVGSLRDLSRKWAGIDPAEPHPASLDARRAAKTDDGYVHCPECGGATFTATIAFRSNGRPEMVLPPQKCLGCGWLRQETWPPLGG